jgi:hypothetical protein
VVGDFNRDGKPDFAVTVTPSNVLWNNPTDSVYVGLNSGGGTFSSGGGFAAGVWGTNSLVAADVNGDGSLDLVTAGAGSNGPYYGMSVLLGNGVGAFGAAQYTFVSRTQQQPALVAVGDFNGDHFADVAVGYWATSEVDVLLNAGSGTQKHKG